MDTSPQKKMRSEEEESISVFVRIRPLNSIEKNKNSYSILDAPGTREVIVKERQNTHVTKTFTFDRAFGPDSKQVDVYKAVVAPLLDQVLQGYNCTVFAYGQTGTGKTYTMEGERSQETLNWSEDPKAGIVPRALGQLFDTLRELKAEFTIRVSLLELYNEELYDLLAPVENQKFQNLKMYEDPKNKNILIQGLEEVIVRTKSEVYQIMEKGSERRKTAATWMNAASSRSHTVLTVTVQVKESTMAGEDLIKVGKLHLVDLAGSENIGRSGAVDKRAREAGNINQSLLTLGRVITALVERAPHVPYRESKLTRILKDSLGGNTKTSIIATVSPAYINVEETLSTLEYAHRAKNILNQPTVNQRLTKHVMLGHYAEEVERLRRDLAATREKNGVFVEKTNYDEMQARLIGLEQECTNNATHIRNLNSDVEKCQEDLRNKEVELEETSSELAMVKAVLAETTETLNNTRKQLRETEQEKEVQQHLVEKHVLTERKINEEATTLMKTADVATNSLEKLYSKLERKRSLETNNLEAGKRMKKEVQEKLEDISEGIEKFRTDHAEFCGEQRLRLEEFLSSKDQLRNAWRTDVENLYKIVEAACAESLGLVTAHSTAMKSTNSTLDTEVSKRCESMLEAVETVISSLNGLRNEVATKLDKIDTEVSELMDSFKSQLESQQKHMSTFLAKHMDDMAEQSGSLQCLMDDCEKSASTVTTQLQQRKEAATAQNKEMQKYITGLVASLQTMSTSLTESDKNNSAGIDQIMGALKSSTKDIKGKLEKLQGDSRTQTNTAVHVQQELNQNYEKNARAIQEKRPVFANALKEMNTEISNSTATGEKYGAIQKESIENLQKWHHSTIKGIGKGVSSFKKNFISKHGDLNNCNSSAIKSNQKYVNMFRDQDTTHVVSHQKSLSKHCQEAEAWSEDQRSKVHEQAGIVSEFWDATYLVDNPTGVTPRKQNFSYPKTISATSPHDRIISRFRAAKKYDDDEDRENF